MELNIKEIKNIYKKRISLLQDLLDCINSERDHLLNRNINGIWSVMEEKNDILESIDKTKKDLLQIAGKEPGYKDIPKDERQSIVELSQKLTDLKQEIKVRVRENMIFINETLGFFHEIVTVFAAAGHTNNSYGPAKYAHKEPILYQSEV